EGVAIDVQKKARNKDFPLEKVNWKVRNHDNGFVFVRGFEDDPDVMNCINFAKSLAVHTVDMLDLDFGAVDLIYNKKRDSYCVLEVNTAPGLECQTIYSYANSFKKYFHIGEKVKPEKPKFGLDFGVPKIDIGKIIFPNDLELD